MTQTVTVAYVAFLILAIPQWGFTAPKAIHWDGQISSVTSFSTGSVPPEVHVGARIAGELKYETSGSTGSSYQMGDTSGYKHHFTNQFMNTISVGTNHWQIEGGYIGFLYNRNMPWDVIDMYCTTNNSQYLHFPNYVGRYEFGFALFDNISPYQLYKNSSSIYSATIHWTHMSRNGSGHLCSRRWEGGDIVEGYYISFTINSASPTEIPPDEDQDGLSDAWEQTYYGNATNGVPSAISSNGINSVYQAFVAGLDPNDHQSLFTITGSATQIQWPCVSGRFYSIYWSTNLLQGFQLLQDELAWPQNAYTTDPNIPISFYRIEARMDDIQLSN